MSVVRSGSAIDARDDARHDEVAEGVDGGRFERVDLLGHAHRAELGADPGADPARQQKPGRKRPGLAHQGDRQPGRNHRFGAEPLERGAGVHREHHADGHARYGDQRRRAQAELIDLSDGLPELERGMNASAQRAQREQREFTGAGKERDDEEPARANIRAAEVQGAYQRRGFRLQPEGCVQRI